MLEQALAADAEVNLYKEDKIGGTKPKTTLMTSLVKADSPPMGSNSPSSTDASPSSAAAQLIDLTDDGNVTFLSALCVPLSITFVLTVGLRSCRRATSEFFFSLFF